MDNIAKHGGKFRVYFDINPELPFENKEEYSLQGIIPIFEDEKLVKLQTDVDIDPSTEKNIIGDLAKNKITALLERLRYITRQDLKATLGGIDRIGPPKIRRRGRVFNMRRIKTIRVNPRIPKPCSMPKEDVLIKQDPDLTYQLTHLNKGILEEDIGEKIKNYYLVIEREKEINPSYIILDTLTYIRHALVHARVNKNQKAESFLNESIGSNSIDLNNPKHIRFLREMLPSFEEKAQEIVNKKIS